jgi:WD40 repeat protein
MEREKTMQPIRLFCVSFLVFAYVLSACSSGIAPTATSTATLRPSETPSPTSTITPTVTPQLTIDKATCEKYREIYHLGDGALNMLVYSPDGRWLAAATTTGVALYDAASLAEIWKVKTEANLQQIAFSADNKTLSGVDSLVNMYTWQVEDGSQSLIETPTDMDEPPMSFALSPDGTMLAVPYYDESIHLYQTDRGGLMDRIEQLLSMGEMIYRIAYSPDGSRLATISYNGEIRIWNIPQKSISYRLNDQEGQDPVGMVFSPNGKTLAVNYETESGEESVRMLDVASGKWQNTLEGKAFSFTPDNLLLGTADEEITLREHRSGKVLNSLPGGESTDGLYALSPDGTSLAAGAGDGIHVRGWDGESRGQKIEGQNTAYTALALSPGDDLFAAGTADGVEIHRLQDGGLVQELVVESEPDPIAALAYSPTGDLVAGISGSTIHVWDVKSSSQLWSQDTGHTLNELAFSPDGMTLAGVYSENSPGKIAGVASQILLWNARDGGRLVELQGPEQILYPGYTSLAFSPDGSHLIAAEGGGKIDVWSFDTGELEDTLADEDSFMSWNPIVAASPDQEHFASGSMDRQIHLWKFGKSDAFRKMNAWDDSITALAYTGRGDAIAAGVGNDIRLWNADIGSSLCSIHGSSDTVRKIFFTHNGPRFVSLADDGIIRVWDIGQP